MGGTELSGNFQRADFDLRGKPRAAVEAPGRPVGGRGGDYGGLPCGRGLGFFRAGFGAGRAWRGAELRAEILAFLAALVSASVFSFLFRGNERNGAADSAAMAGREADRVRSLANGS